MFLTHSAEKRICPHQNETSFFKDMVKLRKCAPYGDIRGRMRHENKKRSQHTMCKADGQIQSK